MEKLYSFFSVDGILGKESLVILANFILLVAAKMDETIPQVCG